MSTVAPPMTFQQVLDKAELAFSNNEPIDKFTILQLIQEIHKLKTVIEHLKKDDSGNRPRS
jgi:hypothetical protein